MRRLARNYWPWTLGALAVALVLLVASAAGGSSSTARSRAEFNETEILHTIGNETETWRTRIYTRQGKFAGSGVVACTPASTVSSLQQCTGTYLLPRGRVVVEGLLSSRAGFNFVVIGGTDAYLGARGIVVVAQTATGPRRSRLTLFFQ